MLNTANCVWTVYIVDCNVEHSELCEDSVHRRLQFSTHKLSSMRTLIGAWNSSVGGVLGSLSCLMQHHGFNPPLRIIFPVEGIFPLELT